jgi:LysM repeat protein
MLKIFSLASVIITASALSLHASNKELEQEYIQVRKIALKDARVQAAFERANEKLDERIIEIDPTLKPYVNRSKSAATAPVKTPQPKHTTTPKKNATDATTHIVARGENLSTIAEHYKISTASLKSANNISNDRKLRVGQKLLIPQTKAPEAGPGKSDGLWNRIKKSLD